MPHLQVNGISLAYDDVGPRDAARTVFLLHGYASNRNENWRRMGWLSAFERRRLRAVAIDLRGHGESDKPHDPAAYLMDTLSADVVGVIEALELRSVALMGYSMGARLALATALTAPQRFAALILGGVGESMFEPPVAENPMTAAMEASDIEAISDPLLRSFRQFADEQGEDRQALAAFAKARGGNILARDALPALRLPTLVVAGARDELAGDVDGLAREIPGAKGVTLPGCDHFSAIPHALFKAAVFDFFEEIAF